MPYRSDPEPNLFRLATFISGFLLFALLGCAAQPDNPSFPVTAADAEKQLDAMHAHPTKLRRPLVIIGGMNDPFVGAWWARRELSRALDSSDILGVSLFFCSSFDSCRDHIIDQVQTRFPQVDLRQTVEVDVVGISLGGVAARYAALDQPGRPRLRIKRLFTLSAPHRGATVASQWPVVSSVQKDMRAGSEFLNRLNAQPIDYQIVPYVRLGDTTVGTVNAAPEGQTPIWLPCPALQTTHSMAVFDVRVLTDIARRLRDEPPLATEPREPLP